MSLTLAAVGAVVVALLELTVVPYFRIGGAQPDLVLVFAVVWTVVAGIEGGLIWAFIGGLMIDFLAPRPLGLTAFTLLISVGGAALLGRLLERVRYIAPVIAVLVFAMVNSLLFLVVYGALRGPILAPDPIGMVLPGAIYSTAIAAIVGPLGVFLAQRRHAVDRIDW
ncbi:MAG TPA: rod shape-determining protein MreD [Candidatus Saccharimonadales bacterium]|nr:rod shape-determining protein MreD [Candidatus Saccharimonadales bacterium]